MNTTTQPGPLEVRLSDLLGLVPERTYTRAQLLAAIEAERHACSIAVWMTKMDATDEDADDLGVAGWLEEAEQRVKNRSANDPDVVVGAMVADVRCNEEVARRLKAERDAHRLAVEERTLRLRYGVVSGWIVRALKVLDTLDPEDSTEADELGKLIAAGEMLALTTLANSKTPNVANNRTATAPAVDVPR